MAKYVVNGFDTPNFTIPIQVGSASLGAEDVEIDVIGAPVLTFPEISTIQPATLNQKITVVNVDAATSHPSFKPFGYDTFSSTGSGVTLAGASGLGQVRRFQPAANKINAQGGGVWSVTNC